MGKYVFDKLEFYITNVCNLTCNGCNRYNNHKFSGFWAWEDAEPILKSWATKIDITDPVILGGEPLLHPEIIQWVVGLRKIFPNLGTVQIQSNGTRIDCVKGLFDVLVNGNWIGISLHDLNDRDEIFARVKNFLGPDVVMIEDKDKTFNSDYQFMVNNHIKVYVWTNTNFVQSNIIELGNNRYTLYSSNPDQAHENCSFRRFKNYHMVRGKIYKCGPVALMPEFDQQYHFDISDEDRLLLNSYQPLTVDNYDTIGTDWLENIDNVISQCKFCPERYDYKPITFSDLKKPWKKEPKEL